MEQKNIFSRPLFIGNVVVACLMAIVLWFFIQYPAQYDSLLYRMLLVVIFAVMFFWKPFLLLILIVSGAGMVYIIRNWSKGVSKIKSEMIILVFGVAVAMSVGFVFSSSIRSGKPNIEPSDFFPHFTVALLLYLIARIGVGILTAVRNKPKG